MAWFFPTSRITREEHDEFRRRIEQEEERQNRRLELCEMSIKEWNSLTTYQSMNSLLIWGICSENKSSKARDWKH